MSELSFRAVTPEDDAFLLELYASTRAEELDQVAWGPGERETFVRMQFRAQISYWDEHIPGTDKQIVLVGGEPAGRLYVDRREDEHRLVDIALLPRFRGRGLGTRLLEGVFAQARAAGKCVRIHVERFNPALRLYQRLGFTEIGDTGVYLLMEWRPS